MNGSVAHLFSGGVDSSLAACRLARSFKTVHLNTFVRFGFLWPDASAFHAERIRARFPGVRFVHRLLDADRLYRYVESIRSRPAGGAARLLSLNTCGHCKVALHWRNLLFCIEEGVRFASDGAVLGAEQFAEQNPRILMPELEALYGCFGITLLHPSREEGLSTEEELYRLGVTDDPRVKMTRGDRQVVCTQHILFAMMMRTLLEACDFAEYERLAREHLAAKIRHIQEVTEEFVRDRAGKTVVAGLLGRR